MHIAGIHVGYTSLSLVAKDSDSKTPAGVARSEVLSIDTETDGISILFELSLPFELGMGATKMDDATTTEVIKADFISGTSLSSRQHDRRVPRDKGSSVMRSAYDLPPRGVPSSNRQRRRRCVLLAPVIIPPIL